MSDTFISVDEAAKRFSVCRQTVRRWLKAGRVHGIRPGGSMGPGGVPWRISEASITEFLKASPSNQAAPTEE